VLQNLGFFLGMMHHLAEYSVPIGDNATSRGNSGNFRYDWLRLYDVVTFGMKWF